MKSQMCIKLCLLLTCCFFSQGQLNFGLNDFLLTASKTFIHPGDDVTFKCDTTSTSSSETDTRRTPLVFPDSKGVVWERNGQALFSAQEENGHCRVKSETVLGRPAITARDLKSVTCTQEGMTVSVVVRNVSVTPGGDRWLCSRFPFLQSNVVSLVRFVPVTSVTLIVDDLYPDDVRTGILMILRCITSPSNPEASVSWRFQQEGKPIELPQGSRLQTSVDGYGRVTAVSELLLDAEPRYEGVKVHCVASNQKAQNATSDETTLTVRRAPRLLLSASPSGQVLEGQDVTLTCGAHGHPKPTVRWKKQGGFLPNGLLQSDMPVLTLRGLKVSDSGEFTCTASNGVRPEAVNSLYLRVLEPVKVPTSTESIPDKVSDKPAEKGDKFSQNGTDDTGGSSNTVAVAVSLVILIIIIAVVTAVLLWVWHKKKRKRMKPTTRMYSSDRANSAPRQGVFASISSLRHSVSEELHPDENCPQYLDLPPAPYPPPVTALVNKGYGLESVPRLFGSERPLPSTPSDKSLNTTDSGYDEIRDVFPVTGRISLDGYEIPVLQEEEEEVCIYDMARPPTAQPAKRNQDLVVGLNFSTQL